MLQRDMTPKERGSDSEEDNSSGGSNCILEHFEEVSESNEHGSNAGFSMNGHTFESQIYLESNNSVVSHHTIAHDEGLKAS